ncbi:alginate lyase family protein [Ruania halotolerans]|uniref:alginate lyase family protein n=1 Tax=Ruania halotolerans TaxID=2897773 RepID=UPI001E339332|nr:alginate lyase family protein [Ruania halotolerans]UFU06997.1 alginate lyase family protein [Ruania halotolerans]
MSKMMARWRLLPVLLVALLAGAVVPTAASATPGEELSDSFETLHDHWLPVSGNWRTADGAVVSNAVNDEHGHKLALFGHRLAGDGGVTATFELTGQAAASTWGGVSVHRAGVQDGYTTSGYTALVRRNGELAIIKADGGNGVTYLARANTAARPGEGPISLTFEVTGEALSASVAGTTITATDSAFRDGGVSIFAHRDTAVSVAQFEAQGLVQADDTVPLPEDCLPPTEDTTETGRGDVLISDDRLDMMRQRLAQETEPQTTAFAQLMDDVAADVEREPFAPSVWFVPFFYNDPDAHREARDGLQADANAAYRLALAYRLTGDASYGVSAAGFVEAWTYEVECFRTSQDSALAFSYHFPAMVFAADLLRDTQVWSAEVEADFASMLRQQALEISSSISSRGNNWGNWGVSLSTAIAAYLGDDDLMGEQIERARELVDHQIDADGHLAEEVTRNSGVGDYGIWYSHFSLLPALLTAEIAELHGFDLFSYENSHGFTLGDAVEVLAGWVETPESFPYFDGPVEDLANVRTIDYLSEDGVMAHSMSYFEIAGSRYDLPAVNRLLAVERPMTTIHAAPHLTLTHGDLSDEPPVFHPQVLVSPAEVTESAIESGEVTVTASGFAPDSEVALFIGGIETDSARADSGGAVVFVLSEAVAVGVHVVTVSAAEGSAEAQLVVVPGLDPDSQIPDDVPSEDDLTPGTEGGIAAPATASERAVILVSMSSDFAGERVGLWIFSQPTYMGTYTVGTNGTVSVALPAGMVGERRIAAYSADQSLIGWDQINVRAAGGTDGDPGDGGSDIDADDSSTDGLGVDGSTPEVDGVDDRGALAETGFAWIGAAVAAIAAMLVGASLLRSRRRADNAY